MKKNLKKILLLMMAMLLMLSFVACSSEDDDDDDDKDDDKKTEANKDAGNLDDVLDLDDDDDDKKNNAADADDDDKKTDAEDTDDDKKTDAVVDEKPNKKDGKDEAEKVAEDFLDAFEDLDIDAMSELVVDDAEMFAEDTMEAFEQFENGKLTYDEDGVKCEMYLEVKSKLEDVEEIDVDDLKDMMEDSDSYDDIDFDKISEVYECSASISMKITYGDIKVDPSAMDLTQAELEQFEAEMGMSIEEVMKSYLDEAFEQFNDEMDVCVYIADYDGDWKVIFAD